MISNHRLEAYLENRWLEWYYRHGGEEIVGPLGELGWATFNPQPDPPARGRRGPSPEPWRVAIAQLFHAAQAKDLAMQLPEGQQKDSLKSAVAAIDGILEDWCGKPPRFPYPWPWPGPPPWVWEIASELSLVANSLQPGTLRGVIQDISIQTLQKASAEG